MGVRDIVENVGVEAGMGDDRVKVEGLRLKNSEGAGTSRQRRTDYVEQICRHDDVFCVNHRHEADPCTRR